MKNGSLRQQRRGFWHREEEEEVADNLQVARDTAGGRLQLLVAVTVEAAAEMIAPIANAATTACVYNDSKKEKKKKKS